MARDLETTFETAIEGSVVKPFLMFDLDFSSPVYLWTGYGDITYNSGSGNNTYIGAGTALDMSALEEVQDLSAAGITLTLAGLGTEGTELLTKALTEEYQGKDVTIILGALDDSGDIIDDPIIVYKGFMDTLSINESAETSSISLTVENKLIMLRRNNERRYTDNDQKTYFPGDRGFEFVASIAEKDMTWGGRTEKMSLSPIR